MADRNEEKRTEIWRKIVKIEDKEDRLRATKKQYEQQLTNFYSDIQSIHHRMINLLSLSPSSRQLIEQIESDNRTHSATGQLLCRGGTGYVGKTN